MKVCHIKMNFLKEKLNFEFYLYIIVYEIELIEPKIFLKNNIIYNINY